MKHSATLKEVVMKRLLAVATLVSVGVVATLAAQQLERINPPGLSTPQTYSHIVKAGKLMFIAGQVGATADGKPAGAGMREQTRMAVGHFRNVEPVPVNDRRIGQPIRESDSHGLAARQPQRGTEIGIRNGPQRLGRALDHTACEAPHARGRARQDAYVGW